MNLLKVVEDILGKAAVGAPVPESSPVVGALLAVPDVVQREHWDCGSAACMSVCRYFGVGPLTEEEYIREIPSTPEEGTPPDRIVAFLRKVGLRVDERHGMTVDDLRDCWRHAMPVMCPVQNYGTLRQQSRRQSGHWVVVVGVWGGNVFVQDPAADKMHLAWRSDAAPGLVMVREDDWDRAWIDADASGNVFDHYGIMVGSA